MLSAGGWRYLQQNTITFVLVDAQGLEVAGLGATFTVELAKGEGVFDASAGSKSEIGYGWYRYVATADEADTIGPVAVRVTAPGTVQQNLEYVVEQRTVQAIPVIYTVTNSQNAEPIEGVYVSFATDVGNARVVWTGYSDGFGVARDSYGGIPRLDPGTYFVFRKHGGYIFSDPDVEVISA